MRMIRKAVVTGPTGVIGTALIRELIRNGVDVAALCRKDSPRKENLPQSERIRIVDCDLEHLAELKDILKPEYDVFFHLGWCGTFGADRADERLQLQNVRYALDAVDAAAALGCRCFVGAGSQAEYGRTQQVLNGEVPTFPENGYGIAKLCAGQMSRLSCERLGMEHIWARILSVFGPCDGEETLVSSLIASLLKGEKPHCTKGEQIWDYCYSGDIAHALYLLAEKGVDKRIYCLGSGEGKPLRTYMEEIRDMIDPSLEIGFGDVPYGEKQVMHLCADLTDLKEDTGFETVYGFEKGMEETIAWIRRKMEMR